MSDREKIKLALTDLAAAIESIQESLSWKPMVGPYENNVFHEEHCHLSTEGSSLVLCFGHLYFFNDGTRLVAYICSATGKPINIICDDVDALKKSFATFVSHGLVSPNLSREEPEEASTPSGEVVH